MKGKILSSVQQKLLKVFSEDKRISEKFYLTGGTALAGFYLGHRYSDDLDFFCDIKFNK
jgi:predicted nucleotidyltransferase component of viral defense system